MQMRKKVVAVNYCGDSVWGSSQLKSDHWWMLAALQCFSRWIAVSLANLESVCQLLDGNEDEAW